MHSGVRENVIRIWAYLGQSGTGGGVFVMSRRSECGHLEGGVRGDVVDFVVHGLK